MMQELWSWIGVDVAGDVGQNWYWDLGCLMPRSVDDARAMVINWYWDLKCWMYPSDRIVLQLSRSWNEIRILNDKCAVLLELEVLKSRIDTGSLNVSYTVLYVGAANDVIFNGFWDLQCWMGHSVCEVMPWSLNSIVILNVEWSVRFVK